MSRKFKIYPSFHETQPLKGTFGPTDVKYSNIRHSIKRNNMVLDFEI